MTKEDEGREIRPYHLIINEIQSGEATTQLSLTFADVTAAVLEARKKASLTVTFTVDLIKGSEKGVVVGMAIKTNLPKNELSSMFYATEDGKLSRNHPDQPALPGLRDASGVFSKGSTA